MRDHEHDALWQGALPPDLEPLRVSAMRLPLAPEPDWKTLRFGSGPQFVARVRTALAIAASVALLLSVAWLAHDAWRVQAIDGRVSTSGLAFAGRVATGATICTDATSRARVEVPQLGGIVTLEPGGCMRRERDVRGEPRVELERGTLHATANDSEGGIIVATSAGTAVGTGSHFTVTVNDSGGGRLEVTRGRVVFERDGRESRLSAGLWSPLTTAGAGVPRRRDATPAFLEALAVTDNPACQTDDFSRVLVNAQASDAITLWSLLPRVPGKVRRQVAERIAELIEVPREVAIERVLALEPAALEAWWNALGVGPLEPRRRDTGNRHAPG
jgi:hypothetical protein